MPAVRYEFVASGAESVERAFEGIEKSARRQKRAVEESARATQRAARGPGGANAQDRKFKEAERAAAKYERDAQREVKATERAAAQKVRAEERAAAAKTRTNERAAAKDAAAQERAQKHVARIKDRHFAEEQRKHDRHEREVARKKVAAQKRANAEATRSREKSFGTLKDIGSGAVLGTVAAGAAVIGSAARDAVQLQEASARIAINSRKAGGKALDPNVLRRGFEQTAINTPGQTAAGIADAVGKFVSLTGDVDTALKSQGTFATVASATGGNVGDIAEAAASLSQQFDISGIEDMRDALAALTFQGKEGSFELKDAAAQFQRLAASGAAFGIPKGVSGVKTLGGLTQIARSGTGSAEQAATAVENLLTNLKVKQSELKRSGVDVFDKSGKARDVRDLIVESISKVGGADMAKKSKGLTQIFGEQGIRAINPLVAKYGAAFQGTKGTDEEKTAAGIAALRAEIERSINAPGDWADVQEDAAMAQKDASAQITGAWEKITAKVGDALLPSFGNLAQKVADNADALDPFIEAIGLGAEMLGVMFDTLADVPIIGAAFKKKEKSKVQLGDEAQKALEKFDKKQGIGPLTAADQAKRDALAAAAAGAQDAVFEKVGTSGKGMSKDEFVAQYMAAGGIAAEDKGSVDMLAGALQKDTTGARSNDFFQRVFGGENQAQQDIRHQFESAVTAQKTIGQGEAEQNLSALAANAKTASDALAKFNAGQQGSIVTGQ
jgi:hypothetical protein